MIKKIEDIREGDDITGPSVGRSGEQMLALRHTREIHEIGRHIGQTQLTTIASSDIQSLDQQHQAGAVGMLRLRKRQRHPIAGMQRFFQLSPDYGYRVEIKIARKRPTIVTCGVETGLIHLGVRRFLSAKELISPSMPPRRTAVVNWLR